MPNVLVASKALIEQDGKYLLIEQKVGNVLVFDLPGGKIRFGETPEQTLHREVLEEIKSEIRILKILGVWWFFRKDNEDQVVCLTYLCRLKNHRLDLFANPSPSEKITRRLWVSKKELTEKFTEESFVNLINQYEP